MKKTIILAFVLSYSLFFTQCKSGLITMTNGCYTAIQNGESEIKSGNYSAALDQFNKVLDQCKAYDAKEKGYAGKAQALNGLKQYNEAIEAATEGLKIKNTSIDNLFQRAEAYLNLDRATDAKADFSKIIDLTGQNKNVADRATVYAKIAEIDLRQKMYADGLNNLNAAISLDSTNPAFYILQGDFHSAQNNFQEATSSYDKAIAHGANAAVAWKAKAEGQIKYYQQKYNTTGATELAGKMLQSEKENLCHTLSNAKINGVHNMNFDLLQVSICN